MRRWRKKKERKTKSFSPAKEKHFLSFIAGFPKERRMKENNMQVRDCLKQRTVWSAENSTAER